MESLVKTIEKGVLMSEFWVWFFATVTLNRVPSISVLQMHRQQRGTTHNTGIRERTTIRKQMKTFRYNVESVPAEYSIGLQISELHTAIREAGLIIHLVKGPTKPTLSPWSSFQDHTPSYLCRTVSLHSPLQCPCLGTLWLLCLHTGQLLRVIPVTK